MRKKITALVLATALALSGAIVPAWAVGAEDGGQDMASASLSETAKREYVLLYGKPGTPVDVMLDNLQLMQIVTQAEDTESIDWLIGYSGGDANAAHENVVYISSPWNDTRIEVFFDDAVSDTTARAIAEEVKAAPQDEFRPARGIVCCEPGVAKTSYRGFRHQPITYYPSGNQICELTTGFYTMCTGCGYSSLISVEVTYHPYH